MIFGGLLIVYGACIIWILVALIIDRGRAWQRVALLSAYLCVTAALSIWLMSIRWASGMVAVMFGPGALIAICRLAYVLLFRIVQWYRGRSGTTGSPR